MITYDCMLHMYTCLISPHPPSVVATLEVAEKEPRAGEHHENAESKDDKVKRLRCLKGPLLNLGLDGDLKSAPGAQFRTKFQQLFREQGQSYDGRAARVRTWRSRLSLSSLSVDRSGVLGSFVVVARCSIEDDTGGVVRVAYILHLLKAGAVIASVRQ